MFSSQTDRIEKNLTLHPPIDPVIGHVMDELRDAMKFAAHQLDVLVPEGREKSMALTSIEDACMYGIAGIARDQETVLSRARGRAAGATVPT